MARYIDADDLKAVIKANDWSNPVVPDVVCVIINRTPTADVVPKSEVDEIVRQWKEEAICWQNNYITELRANEQIKAEVAREIFELIECAFSPVLVYNGYTIKEYLAELKKKYTGETP